MGGIIVLEDVDEALLHCLAFRQPDKIGLLNGWVGFGLYFLMRIQNPNSYDMNVKNLINQQALVYIIDEINQSITNSCMSKMFKEETYFDLSWNCTSVLWMLIELHEKGIYVQKTEKMISKVITFLNYEKNRPRLLCNNMLLSIIFEKLKRFQNFEYLIKNDQLDGIVGVKKNYRNGLKKELLQDDFSLRHGTTGIAWMYHQLFELTGTDYYRNERNHWSEYGASLMNRFLERTELELNKKPQLLGLFQGIAGPGLMALLFSNVD